eukprot:COSAG06_NODE_100_length_24132_cov_93.237507_18_plen_105_part_00
MSAPGRKRLERSPSRSKGQSPTATSRENKIEDQEPPITSPAPTDSATCGKGEEGSKKPASGSHATDSGGVDRARERCADKRPHAAVGVGSTAGARPVPMSSMLR